MANITEKEFKASYELGIEVYKKERSIEDAIARLVDVYKMNEASAIMYINFFLHMMRGELYQRSISQACLRYYLENVSRDYPVKQLKIFLEALKDHIKYHKSIGFKVPGLCTIHNEYSKKAGVPQIF